MRSTPAVSAHGALPHPTLAELGHLPRGCALCTSSGALAERGTRWILHAATGAMTRSGGPHEPTLASVAGSITNALLLAHEHDVRRVAIPFVGGRIFLGRIGTTPDELAETIVRAALAERGELELRFVAYSAADGATFERALERVADDTRAPVEVQVGDLTDPALHGADAIVNAANTEVQFGGGLSGAIARATGCPDAIDAEAAAAIRAFWAAQGLE